MISKEILTKMFRRWEEKLNLPKERVTTYFYFCDCGKDPKSFIGYLFHKVRHPTHHAFLSCIDWFVVD